MCIILRESCNAAAHLTPWRAFGRCSGPSLSCLRPAFPAYGWCSLNYRPYVHQSIYIKAVLLTLRGPVSASGHTHTHTLLHPMLAPSGLFVNNSYQTTVQSATHPLIFRAPPHSPPPSTPPTPSSHLSMFLYVAQVRALDSTTSLATSKDCHPAPHPHPPPPHPAPHTLPPKMPIRCVPWPPPPAWPPAPARTPREYASWARSSLGSLCGSTWGCGRGPWWRRRAARWWGCMRATGSTRWGRGGASSCQGDHGEWRGMEGASRGWGMNGEGFGVRGGGARG